MLAAEPLVPEDVAVVPVVPEALAFVPEDFRGPVLKAGVNWCSVLGMLKAAKLLMIFSP
jgi:hypothetical protein